MFLHGSLGHILGNMWSLMIFGDNVEGYLGHLKFLFLYLVGGAFAALAQVYANPTSEIPTLGASGAIAAVMGAYFVYYPRASIHTLIPILFRPVIVAIPAWIFLVFWFGMQIFSGISSPEGPGVAWWAHAGGFGIGVLGAMAFRRQHV
jgi:membrane associated rhomboid family serine protease